MVLLDQVKPSVYQVQFLICVQESWHLTSVQEKFNSYMLLSQVQTPFWLLGRGLRVFAAGSGLRDGL